MIHLRMDEHLLYEADRVVRTYRPRYNGLRCIGSVVERARISKSPQSVPKHLAILNSETVIYIEEPPFYLIQCCHEGDLSRYIFIVVILAFVGFPSTYTSCTRWSDGIATLRGVEIYLEIVHYSSED